MAQSQNNRNPKRTTEDPKMQLQETAYRYRVALKSAIYSGEGTMAKGSGFPAFKPTTTEITSAATTKSDV